MLVKTDSKFFFFQIVFVLQVKKCNDISWVEDCNESLPSLPIKELIKPSLNGYPMLEIPKYTKEND